MFYTIKQMWTYFLYKCRLYNLSFSVTHWLEPCYFHGLGKAKEKCESRTVPAGMKLKSYHVNHVYYWSNLLYFAFSGKHFTVYKFTNTFFLHLLFHSVVAAVMHLKPQIIMLIVSSCQTPLKNTVQPCSTSAFLFNTVSYALNSRSSTIYWQEETSVANLDLGSFQTYVFSKKMTNSCREEATATESHIHKAAAALSPA